MEDIWWVNLPSAVHVISCLVTLMAPALPVNNGEVVALHVAQGRSRLWRTGGGVHTVWGLGPKIMEKNKKEVKSLGFSWDFDFDVLIPYQFSKVFVVRNQIHWYDGGTRREFTLLRFDFTTGSHFIDGTLKKVHYIAPFIKCHLENSSRWCFVWRISISQPGIPESCGAWFWLATSTWLPFVLRCKRRWYWLKNGMAPVSLSHWRQWLQLFDSFSDALMWCDVMCSLVVEKKGGTIMWFFALRFRIMGFKWIMFSHWGRNG